jgi:alkylation response protein AidB-like acyl-CoA dehydrogenase
VDLNNEQRALQDMVRQFAGTEVRPRAAEIDRVDEFPWDLYRQLGELGLLGLTLPSEYGGGDGDNLSLVLALEEVAKASGTVGNALLLAKLQSDFILRFGNDRQRKEYLPSLADGSRICLIAATEPGAGSDVAGISTTAVLQGDAYVVNGAKAYMTCGAVGDLAVVLAKTDPSAGHRGITALLVEKSPDGDPKKGFIVDHKDELLGMRGLGTAGIALADTVVPATNVLGTVGEGFKYAMQSFDTGRIVIATLALGIAQEAFEAAVSYARERTVGGSPIASFQAIQLMLADMSVEIEAARLLIHRAARLKDVGEPFSKAASHAKLFASDVAVRVASNALQVHGGFGYTKEAVVERLYRDAKLTQIYEGTNQIQRIIIAGHVMRAA